MKTEIKFYMLTKTEYQLAHDGNRYLLENGDNTKIIAVDANKEKIDKIYSAYKDNFIISVRGNDTSIYDVYEVDEYIVDIDADLTDASIDYYDSEDLRYGDYVIETIEKLFQLYDIHPETKYDCFDVNKSDVERMYEEVKEIIEE